MTDTTATITTTTASDLLSTEQKKIVDTVLFNARRAYCRITGRETIKQQQEEEEEEQQEELNGIVITGCAGTGKTHVLRAIVKRLDSEQIRYMIVSYLGQAAVNSNGRTIHSAFNLGIQIPPNGTSIESFVAQQSKPQFKNDTVIFIEEFSTCNNFLLSIIDYKLRNFYTDQRTLPFAGRLVVFLGDLLQLQSPCNDQFFYKCDDNQQLIKMGPCYMCPSWESLSCKWFELEHQFRQETDVEFAKCLNAVRCANLGKDVCNKLLERVLLVDTMRFEWPHGILPTFLFCTNRQVDAMNAAQFKRLVENKGMAKTTDDDDQKPFVVYTIRGECRRANGTLCDERDFSVAQLIKQSNVAVDYQLCVGCQVMVRTNIDVSDGICNGTRGVVVDFQLDKMNKQRVLAVKIRICSGRVVSIFPFSFRKYSSGDGTTGKQRCSYSAEYTQIPLVLAWAMTIHKSQGLTISPLAIDIGPTCFEECQVYVALSRATRLDSLYLTNVDFDGIRVRKDICQKYVEWLPSDSETRKQLQTHLSNDDDSDNDDSDNDDNFDYGRKNRKRIKRDEPNDYRYDFDDLFDTEKYPNAGDVNYFTRERLTNISGKAFGVEMAFTPRLDATECDGLARFFLHGLSSKKTPKLIIGVIHRAWAHKYLGEHLPNTCIDQVKEPKGCRSVNFCHPLSFLKTLIFDFWSNQAADADQSNVKIPKCHIVLQEKDASANINNINFFLSPEYLLIASGLTLIYKTLKVYNHDGGIEVFLLKK